MRNKIVVGSWKMNGLRKDLSKVRMICEMLEDAEAEVVLCPPFLLVSEAAQACRDCHPEGSEAHTGGVSAGHFHVNSTIGSTTGICR